MASGFDRKFKDHKDFKETEGISNSKTSAYLPNCKVQCLKQSVI